MSGTLTQEEFFSKMEEITNALRVAKMMLSIVSEEDLKRLRQNIRRADNIVMFVVPPIQFDKAMRNLDEQRELLDWVQDTKALFEICPKT